MNLAVESIVDGVLRASLGLSLAAMAIGVLSRVLKLRSPRLEQWAWGIVLFHGVIVTPLVLSIPVPWPASAAATTPNIRTVQHEPVVATIESSSDVAIPDVPASPPLDFVGTGQAINAKSLANLRESQPADSAVVLSWRHIAFLVWVSGIVLLAGVGGLRYAAFARRIDQSGEIPEEWLDEWRHVCSQMAVVKNVPLVVTDLMGPALVRMPSGYRLVVPRVQWAQLSSVQRRAILRHEAAHLQRGDVWTALIARTVGMIHWFNPFAWWAVQRFEAQAELACDRIAAGDEPTIFAEALLKLGISRSKRIAGAIAVKSESLADRVKQLLSDAPGSPRWKRVAVVAVAVLALLPAAIRVQGVTYGEPKLESIATAESSPDEKMIAVPLNDVIALFDANTGERLHRDDGILEEDKSADYDSGRGVTEEDGSTENETSARSDAPDSESQAPESAVETKEPEEYEIPINVSGKAIDHIGRPVSAAKIYLTSPRDRGKPLAVTETDKDGLYQFEAVPLPIKRSDTKSGQDTGSFEVIGEADGYGFAWRPLKRVYPDVENAVEPNWDTNSVRDLPTRYGLKDKIELDLTFLKASKLSGRIVNDLGEPIGGTAIAIRHCDTEWDREDLNRFGSQYELESINWPELVPPRIKTRRTDADGHFEFDGLPANCRFWIEVRPPGYTPRNIHAVTHDRADVDEAGNRVYNGNFEVDFVRPHKVNIRVVYGDSGEPAPKVGIGGNVSEAGFWETTDENGMVEVPLPDGRYKLRLLPRYGTNYLRTEFELAVSADSVKDIVEIKLRPAAVVDITVLDVKTKKPLADVDVWLADEGSTPQRLNRRVHGYRSWEVETRISHYESPRSDKEGKMRVLFEPGTHRIGVGLEASPSWYIPVEGDGRSIDCKAGETVTAEFHLKNVKKAR
ncbi:MAG: M56 family metallopeptidase [Planctomycetaceae bacterium]